MKKMIFRLWGRSIMFFFGWKVDQVLKTQCHRCVMVGAPHTSNWDFVFARAAFEVMRLPVRFTIKKEWMDSPLGWLSKALGAIAIDRKSHEGDKGHISMVDAMANLFQENPGDLVILVTPEGTRSRVEHWKTGFYYVAKQAGVPIALGYMDYQKKIAGIGKVIWPTENMEEDMKQIMAFYGQVHPKFPEKFSLDSRFLP